MTSSDCTGTERVCTNMVSVQSGAGEVECAISEKSVNELVHLGEPIAFHAIYIVRCVEDSAKECHTSEIVAFGRLGTSVKKRAVLASLSGSGVVSYITLSWLDT